MRLGQNRKALPPALFGNVDLALGAVKEEKRTVPYTPVCVGGRNVAKYLYIDEKECCFVGKSMQ